MQIYTDANILSNILRKDSSMKKVKVGYLRISSEAQILDRQRRNIKNACPEAILIEEKYTGTTMKRPNWTKLMASCEKGNVSDIYFDEPSRMGRTAKDCFDTYKHLYLDLGINLHFLKGSHINTSVYQQSLANKMSDKITADSADPAANKMLNAILEAIQEYMLALIEKQIFLVFQESENEAKLLGERTKSGLAAAKRRGVKFNNNLGYHYKNKEEWRCRYLIIKYHVDFGGVFGTKKVAVIINHSIQCTQKYIDTLKVEQGMMKLENSKYANKKEYNYEIIGAHEFKEMEDELWVERFGYHMKPIRIVKNKLDENTDMQE